MALQRERDAEYAKELLDLAEDVKRAGHLEFYEDHGDRAPDGTRLTNSGQRMIEEALRFQAAQITKK